VNDTTSINHWDNKNVLYRCLLLHLENDTLGEIKRKEEEEEEESHMSKNSSSIT
jgi:hypothetical protein